MFSPLLSDFTCFLQSSLESQYIKPREDYCLMVGNSFALPAFGNSTPMGSEQVGYMLRSQVGSMRSLGSKPFFAQHKLALRKMFLGQPQSKFVGFLCWNQFTRTCLMFTGNPQINFWHTLPSSHILVMSIKGNWIIIDRETFVIKTGYQRQLLVSEYSS